MTQELEKLKEWIGQKESDVDYVTVPAVHRLAATLDRDDPMPKMGDPLPVGWHQILFPRVVRHSQIGARRPPAARRFSAAGAAAAPHVRRASAPRSTPICSVGDDVRRDSVIQDVTIKQGRTGQMVFVTVQDRYHEPARARHHRGAGLRLSRSRPLPAARRPSRRSPRRARRSGAHGHARPGDAVPLFRAHLQRPPHPLRPAVRDPDRGLPRSRHERRADDAPRVRARARPRPHAHRAASPRATCARCS